MDNAGFGTHLAFGSLVGYVTCLAFLALGRLDLALDGLVLGVLGMPVLTWAATNTPRRVSAGGGVRSGR